RVSPAAAALSFLGGTDDQRGRKPQVFLQRYRPRLAKPLPRSIGNSIDLRWLQCVGCDRQSPSKGFEKYEERLFPLVRGGDTKRDRPVVESRFVSREFV